MCPWCADMQCHNAPSSSSCFPHQIWKKKKCSLGGPAGSNQLVFLFLRAGVELPWAPWAPVSSWVPAAFWYCKIPLAAKGLAFWKHGTLKEPWVMVPNSMLKDSLVPLTHQNGMRQSCCLGSSDQVVYCFHGLICHLVPPCSMQWYSLGGGSFSLVKCPTGTSFKDLAFLMASNVQIPLGCNVKKPLGCNAKLACNLDSSSLLWHFGLCQPPFEEIFEWYMTGHQSCQDWLVHHGHNLVIDGCELKDLVGVLLVANVPGVANKSCRKTLICLKA